jgi:hypothetical protein
MLLHMQSVIFIVVTPLFLLVVLQPSSSLDCPSDDPPFISIHSYSFTDAYSDVSKVFDAF